MSKTLFGTNLKREILDILDLLLRLKGASEVLNFEENYFYLVKVIYVEGKYIDWAHIMCDKVTSWLNLAKAFKQFYISFYLLNILLVSPSLIYLLSFVCYTLMVCSRC